MGIIGLVFFVWSYPLINFQSPAVLSPGERFLGVGMAGPYPFRNGEVAIYGRIPLAQNLDGGGKFFLPPGFVADIKASVSTKPILTALDIGLFSFWGWGKNSDYGYGVLAQILGGRSHFYGGVKVLYWLARNSSIESHLLPEVLIGASIGNRYRITPEVAVAFGANQSGEARGGLSVLVGLGFQTFEE
jgi:hypothetical protein